MQGVIVSSNGPVTMMINQGDWWGEGQRTKGPDVEWIIPIPSATSPHGDIVQIRKWHLFLKVFYHLPPKFVKTGKKINGREVAADHPLRLWKSRWQPCLYVLNPAGISGGQGEEEGDVPETKTDTGRRWWDELVEQGWCVYTATHGIDN